MTIAPEQPTRVLETPSTVAPRLCAGIELVGEFAGSGFKEAPYIARRSDGQMVQMPPMLYALAELVDGHADETMLAARFSERIERQVEPDMIHTLLEDQLRPLGVVAPADGSELELNKVDPLLALKFRTKVVPKGFVRALTSFFKPLFFGPVVVLVVAAFVALDVWLFGVHGISQSLRGVIYDPALMFMLLAGVVLATTFHEIGHATGTRYGGAEPGVMGVGIYIVWPAFYTDITDAYRLGKGGRLRADLGGMYFNAVFALAAGGAYALTGFEPVLLLIVLQTFAIVQQSLPLLRLDGFYIISDLTGVPDMLGRIKPILQSLIPGREPDKRVTELKPWVRRVVTGYVLTVVPLIALLFALMIMHAPRAFATAYDSFLLHWNRVGPEFSGGRTLKGLKDVLEMAVLVLPLLGMIYTTSRVGRRAASGAAAWSAGNPARRILVVAATAALLGAIAYVWWPNGDYRPIQRGEKGTLIGGLRSLRDLPSGRPALPPQREQELGGAPFEHDAPAADRSGSGSGAEARTETEQRQSAAESTADGQDAAAESTPTLENATVTPEPTATPEAATATPEPTETPAPTVTPAATASPVPTATASTTTPEPTP
jgi:putative peptide zinc metalloprotease protein